MCIVVEVSNTIQMELQYNTDVAQSGCVLL